jgi:hypothetical protein
MQYIPHKLHIDAFGYRYLFYKREDETCQHYAKRVNVYVPQKEEGSCPYGIKEWNAKGGIIV